MKRSTVAMLALLVPLSGAVAQERSEIGSQGYRGGVSSFGGYYETFGGYGGYNTYSGYRRYDGSFSSTTSIFAIPLQGPTEGGNACGYLQRRAQETGSRKWAARYQACRRGN